MHDCVAIMCLHEICVMQTSELADEPTPEQIERVVHSLSTATSPETTEGMSLFPQELSVTNQAINTVLDVLLTDLDSETDENIPFNEVIFCLKLSAHAYICVYS